MRYKEYLEVRAEYLAAHPFCQLTIDKLHLDEAMVIRQNGMYWINDAVIYVPQATAIHHKRGRVGSLLTDTNFFMAVCSEGHRRIHHFTKESYEKGWMLPR